MTIRFLFTTFNIVELKGCPPALEIIDILSPGIKLWSSKVIIVPLFSIFFIS
jgi:hypothetical protein